MAATKTKQHTDIAAQLKEELGLSNINAVPRVQKVTINVGVGKSVKDAAFLDTVEETLTKISGQKPIRTKAKKSISNFKIREGMVIGMKVTIRGQRMHDFITKFVKVTLPRIRDFQGLSPKSVDRNGNLSIGIKESLAFPEVKAEELEKIHGLEVTFTTSAKNKEEGLALFKVLGFPFKK